MVYKISVFLNFIKGKEENMPGRDEKPRGKE
jgi:hypothetical protein